MTIVDPTQILLQRAMEGATMRQQALAGNIANVNTPGYKRQDVDFQTALTNAIDARKPLGGVTFSAATDSTAPARADGNSVDIDQENAELSKNGLQYEALI